MGKLKNKHIDRTTIKLLNYNMLARKLNNPKIILNDKIFIETSIKNLKLQSERKTFEKNKIVKKKWIKSMDVYEKIFNAKFHSCEISGLKNISLEKCNFNKHTIIKNSVINYMVSCNFDKVIFINCEFSDFSQCTFHGCILIDCEYNESFTDTTFSFTHFYNSNPMCDWDIDEYHQSIMGIDFSHCEYHE